MFKKIYNTIEMLMHHLKIFGRNLSTYLPIGPAEDSNSVAPTTLVQLLLRPALNTQHMTLNVVKFTILYHLQLRMR